MGNDARLENRVKVSVAEVVHEKPRTTAVSELSHGMV